MSQVLYLNADGAYVIEGDTVHDFSDAAEFLKQTCKDFLNWFDDDLGLKDGLYTSTGFSLQDGNVVSTWNYTGKDAPPVDSILAVSDAFGRFTKLEMFTEQHELITATTLQDFGCNSGCFYPKKICSVSYEGEEPVVSTELYLSDVKFNAAVDKAYLSRKEYSIQAGDDISVAHKYARPSVPAAVNYRVSIPSILVNTSFKFYKKYITAQDMSNCPFYPSCSQYMLDAVSMNGLFGIIQGWERLHRCTDTEHKRNMYLVMKDGRHYDPVNKLW